MTIGDAKILALGMKQVLLPEGAKVRGSWPDGSAAVTEHDHGKGKAFAVGTMPGTMWMKSGLKAIPYARGGRHTLYNPEGFDLALAQLVRMGVAAGKVEQPVVLSKTGVEALLIDHPQGTLLTLVNWSNAPLKDLNVTVKLPFPPKEVRSVTLGKPLNTSYENGAASFETQLHEAEYFLLLR